MPQDASEPASDFSSSRSGIPSRFEISVIRGYPSIVTPSADHTSVATTKIANAFSEVLGVARNFPTDTEGRLKFARGLAHYMGGIMVATHYTGDGESDFMADIDVLEPEE